MNDINPHFFPKKFKNKKESQTYEKLKDEYFILKEQSSWFEKLLSLIKCEADDRMFKLYATISVEAEDYQKSYKILNEKIKSFKRNSYKKSNLSKKTFSTNKERLSYPLESINEIKTGSARDSSNDKMEVIPFNTKINNELQTFNEDVINQSRLDAEEKFTEKSKVFEASQEISLGNNDVSDVIKLQVYEAWDVEFEKWKNVQNPKLYELFHVIESCSKSVLNGSNKAFLKCLSLYQKECADKNDELKEKKNQIDLYLKNSKEGEIVITYLAQHQKWFDEIFQRIALCRTLILQNEEGLVIQESPRLPSALADNRAEFNNLLTFYLGATDKYNKFRDDLISEENKLNNLNRNFIKLMLGSLNQITNEANVLSDFSKQLDRVNQLKLVIEQEYETKQKIKEKLTLLTSPEIVKFYISRIDPCDADYFKNEDTYLQAVEVPTTAAANYFIPATPQSNICTLPAAFYYTPSMPVCYSAEVVPSNNQLFYSM
jgi:hypothetical protein